mmetsp:Transcript_52103/g.121181  ORF Transcript_52103/g.121181 Transcript_52103/m.121181 type:complete len:377 (+) Transcript_52103:114-1244(+)
MGQRVYLLALFGAHATCSVSMVLLNKTIAQGFDFPWTVLLVQNIGTVLIGYLRPFVCQDGHNPKQVHVSQSAACTLDDSKATALPRRVFGMKVPRKQKNLLWVVLQVVLFMGTIFTSLKALRFISVPLYVVARNTVPAQTALLERVFTSVKLSASAVSGLLCTIIGALLYTYGDFRSGLAIDGLSYAIVLTLTVSACSIVDKTAVRLLGQEEGITPIECNQLRVALALPLNLLCVLALDVGGHARATPGATAPFKGQPGDTHFAVPALYHATMNMSTIVMMCLLLSTIFGFGMGTFNFYLQQAVSAATVQVANILYKLSTTLISLVTHPAPVTGISWFGYSVSLLGIALYTFGPGRVLLPCSSQCRSNTCGTSPDA